MPDQKNTGSINEKRGGIANLTNAGKGRPKGIPNKVTGQLKDMILMALDKAGGVDYLVGQAEENPGPFMTLVGKVLPLQIGGDPDGVPIQTEQVAEDAANFTSRLLASIAGAAARSRASETQH